MNIYLAIITTVLAVGLVLWMARPREGDHRSWFQRLFGYCPHCEQWFRSGVKRRRQNTAYVDEESNYITTCIDCYDEIQALWAEMWDEYYKSSGII